MASLNLNIDSPRGNTEVVQLVELGNGVVQITMQDKEHRNTFSPGIIKGLYKCFDKVAQNKSYKVVILTGYGNYFASGGTKEDLIRIHQRKIKCNELDFFRILLDCEIPVIAAMQGHGIGGGLVFGLYADLVVLSQESIYTTNFMKYGFTPGIGCTLIVPEKFGSILGQEMMYTAQNYSGKEIAKRGIPFPVVPRKDVLNFAKKIAEEMAKNPRLSLITLKEHLTSEIKKKLPEFIDKEVAMHEITFHQSEVANRIQLGFGEVIDQKTSEPVQKQVKREEKILSKLQAGVVELVELGNGVVQITMKDEENCNTFSPGIIEGLYKCFSAVAHNKSYKVVILTGYGNYFASGGTKEQLIRIQKGEIKFNDSEVWKIALDCKIPVISAMQGHGIGGGFLLGLYGDLVVLSQESIYTANFMKYGFTPSEGSTLIMPKKLGSGLSQEMMYGTRNYRGSELEKKGIPFSVLPRKEVLNYARDIANRIAEKPRLSLVTLKEHLTSEIKKALPEFIEKEVAMHEITFHQAEVATFIDTNYGGLRSQKIEISNSIPKQVTIEENVLSKLQSGEISLDDAENLLLGIGGEKVPKKVIEKKKIDNGQNKPINTNDPEEILSLLSSGAISLENAENLLLETVKFEQTKQSNKNINSNFISLVPISRDKNLPLSFEQERLWALAQLIPNGSVHNITHIIQLKGELNIQILERSLNEIIRRHEALRTNFIIVEGSPVQVIAPKIHITLSKVNLLGLNLSDRTSAIQKFVEKESQKPFNLARDPLFDFKLLQLDDLDHVLLLRIHHTIIDGKSIYLLIQELATLYEAFYQGKESPLPELNIQYGDFAVWQRKWLQGERLDGGFTYWSKQLDGFTPLKLPVDRPKPLVSSFCGAHQYFKISAHVWSSLKQLSDDHDVTPFMTLLTTFNILLHKCCKQTDVIVGSPTSGRFHPKLQSLIGFFSDPIPLRNDLSGNLSFEELLPRVRSVVLEAYAHKNIPLTKIVEATKLQRSQENRGLFQVLLSFFGKQQGSISTSNLSLTTMWEATRATTDMDLFLTLSEVDEELRGVFEYNPDLFDQDTIEALINSYCLILEQCVQSPQTQLTQFQLTSELEAKINSEKVQLTATKEDNLETVIIPTVAITATFTSEPVADSLDFWLQELDLNWQIEFAPYNQVFQQLLASDSLLAQNKQGINVVLVRFEDWVRFEEDGIVSANFVQKIEQNVLELIQALKTAAVSTNTSYLLCICPASLDTITSEKRAAFLQKMEAKLVRSFSDVSGVYVVTTTELATTYPVETFYDFHGDKLGHIPFTPLFFTALGTIIARKIHAIRQTPYKVIVLDCDYTLWQGICGEDGANGIVITPAHQALQKFMTTQQDNGMLLCLCSKNNQEDVFQVFEQRQDMLLTKENLVSWRINWQSKSENLQSLSQELQVGLDSFIFIDDNPVECAEVEVNCPEVLTIQLPEDPDTIPRFLQHIWAFDRLKVTKEDKQRQTYYQQNIQREQLRQQSLTLSEFIKSLNLQVQIRKIASSEISRVAQLTQRTNQFNATTIRRSENQIQNLYQSEEYTCLVVKVKDRFGDYGLVGAIAFVLKTDIIEVDTFLLSCRVLGRGVEHRMLANLGTIALEYGLSTVMVNYKPTAKNQPILDFFNSVGEQFKETGEDGYNFLFPSGFCQAIAYHPETTKLQEDLPSQLPLLPLEKTEPGMTQIKSKSALINRIANQLYDVEQISQAIESKPSKRLEKQHSLVPSSTDTEKQLIDLWAKVLRLEKLGINDNFFDLGGNSLLAVQLMSQIREIFQVELPLNELLNVPTVAGLAKSIETSQRGKKTMETASSFIDLDAEAVLDYAIAPKSKFNPMLLSEPEIIFITGATGFLGAFLLLELLQKTQAKIYCLVRSPNASAAQQKIQHNLEKYQIWQGDFSNRIFPILGDLSLPLLGLSPEEFQQLSDRIDVVYHNGAFVNFTYPYSKLKAANVLGTQEVLRLAAQAKVKPVHFISTVAVFDSGDYANLEVAKETDHLPPGETVYGGYAQSKWVAEKLVKIARERGLPVCIYRPGAITGHSNTGEWNTDDAICRILRGTIQLGKIPSIEGWIEMVPVDYVAQSIFYLSQQSQSLGQVFHLVNPQIVSWNQIGEWICAYGYPLEQISYKKWQQELVNLAAASESNPLYPLLPLFFEQVFEDVTLFETLGQRPKFDCQNTINHLAATDLVCPSIKHLLDTYFSYLISKGLIEQVKIH